MVDIIIYLREGGISNVLNRETKLYFLDAMEEETLSVEQFDGEKEPSRGKARSRNGTERPIRTREDNAK